MLTIAESSPEYLFDVKQFAKTTPEPVTHIDVGSLAESKFSTEAISRGYVSWWPVGHSQKADVCVWKPPYRPVTVQVKHAQWKGDCWQVYVAASRGGNHVAKARQGGRELDRYNRYKAGDFDVLAMFVPTANAFKFFQLRHVADKLCVTISDLSTLNNWHVIEDALKHDL